MRVETLTLVILMACLMPACQRDEAADSRADEPVTSEQPEPPEDPTPEPGAMEQATPSEADLTWSIDDIVSLDELAVVGPYDLPQMEALDSRRLRAFRPPECPQGSRYEKLDSGFIFHSCEGGDGKTVGTYLYFLKNVGPGRDHYRLGGLQWHAPEGFTIDASWSLDTGAPSTYRRVDEDLNILVRRYDEESGDYRGGCIFHGAEFISFADDEVDEATNAATCNEVRDDIALREKQGRGVEGWYRPR